MQISQEIRLYICLEVVQYPKLNTTKHKQRAANHCLKLTNVEIRAL